jgi:REP element-mobilizing transposase RayT
MIASCPERIATGGYVSHALNRAVGRSTIFEKVEDYAAFEAVLEEAREQVDMRLLAFRVMPNHWHLVLWPRDDGDLSDFLGWLSNTHTRRWHLAQGTVGTGPLYQGWFKSFPIQEDVPSAKRSGSRSRRSVWDWNPRYAALAAQNASVPTGERSHDAANRHK